MPKPERFSYLAAPGATDESLLRPMLPIRLEYEGRSVNATALVDSGAFVSLLPYAMGLALGAEWGKQKLSIPLSGALGQLKTRALIIPVVVGSFAPVGIVFAWAQTDDVPLILGQTNFFAEFDICFFRSQAAFEIQPKTNANSGGAPL